MKYDHWKDDLQAIDSLLESGRISVDEAYEMREYIEDLAKSGMV